MHVCFISGPRAAVSHSDVGTKLEWDGAGEPGLPVTGVT